MRLGSSSRNAQCRSASISTSCFSPIGHLFGAENCRVRFAPPHPAPPYKGGGAGGAVEQKPDLSDRCSAPPLPHLCSTSLERDSFIARGVTGIGNTVAISLSNHDEAL